MKISAEEGRESIITVECKKQKTVISRREMMGWKGRKKHITAAKSERCERHAEKKAGGLGEVKRAFHSLSRPVDQLPPGVLYRYSFCHSPSFLSIDLRLRDYSVPLTIIHQFLLTGMRTRFQTISFMLCKQRVNLVFTNGGTFIVWANSHGIHCMTGSVNITWLAKKKLVLSYVLLSLSYHHHVLLAFSL